VENLTDAQGMIGSLAADPSLRGLLAVLDLALEGVRRGKVAYAPLAHPLEELAGNLGQALAGAPAPLDWGRLLTGRPARPEEMRRLILTKPVRDFSRLRSGEDALAGVRATAESLGLTADRGFRVRLTGSVAIEAEELGSLEQSASWSVVAALGLVIVLLILGLRSPRIILANLLTLLVGLLLTTAFAGLAIGKLNPISIAFAVLFIGMAVDFGIQVSTRYREERWKNGNDLLFVLAQTGSGIGGPLILAGGTTAVGFFSFLPTAYTGVSELGLIAGVGMGIGVLLNLTLLPALLVLLRPPCEDCFVG
jgi:predicted exporter